MCCEVCKNIWYDSYYIAEKKKATITFWQLKINLINLKIKYFENEKLGIFLSFWAR